MKSWRKSGVVPPFDFLKVMQVSPFISNVFCMVKAMLIYLSPVFHSLVLCDTIFFNEVVVGFMEGTALNCAVALTL